MRNTALFSWLLYIQFFEFFQRGQNQSKDTICPYFIIFLKVCEGISVLASTCWNTVAHPVTCCFLLLPYIGRIFPRWFSSDDSELLFQLISTALSAPPASQSEQKSHLWCIHVRIWSRSWIWLCAWFVFYSHKDLGQTIILQIFYLPEESCHFWAHWGCRELCGLLNWLPLYFVQTIISWCIFRDNDY